jgi:hypothetical protein
MFEDNTRMASSPTDVKGNHRRTFGASIVAQKSQELTAE